jgi:hypothetical protein
MLNYPFSILTKNITLGLLVCCLPLALASHSHAESSPFTEEQLEWLMSDEEHPAAAVNEGELNFLTTAASAPEHHHETTITITENAIKNGWVKLDQCHTDLGLIDSLDIVYDPNRVQSLQIVSTRNIGSAKVNRHTVELQDIGPDSNICIQADSRALWLSDAKHFELKNGPFMRRFLDGYYPLHITLKVIYPSHRLQLVSIEPVAQTGWSIQHNSGTVIADGRFEGELSTRFLFKSRE